MSQLVSKTIGRTNVGFGTPQEYKETEKRLKDYQERLYRAANDVFNKIEANRACSTGNDLSWKASAQPVSD